MARITFNGAPGETHTNTSDKVQYQLIVSWQNSCGVCCQYDRAISSSWPIPFHRRCRCKQIAIYPHKSSQPFVDFRGKIAALAHAEQSRVVGRSNLALVESGLVNWGDVVTSGRIKDFRQVVAERKLTVKQLVKAGVNPRLARAAHGAVHTPAHQQAASQQAELVAKLKALGVEKDALAKAVAERLAARAGIGSGPSGPQPSPIVPTTPRPKPNPAEAARLKAKAEAHARRLAELEARKAEVEAARKRQPAPILPDRPIAERLAAYAEGDRKVASVLKAHEEGQARDMELATRRGTLNRELTGLMDEQDALVKKPRLKAAEQERLAAIQREIQIKQAERDRVKAELKDLHARVREQAIKALAPTDAMKVFVTGAAGADPARSKVEPLTGINVQRAEDARAFVARVLRRGEEDRIAFDVAQIPAGREQRAYFSSGKKYLALSQEEKVDVAVHEMGHAIEETLATGGKPVLDRSLEFLAYRVGDERPQPLNKIFKGTKYGDEEVGRKDRFDQAFDLHSAYYIGKDYGEDGTEILSMGLQMLYNNPVHFAKNDPEYFKYVVGILDGSLR